MPDVNARLAIGRRQFNKLYRVYTNPDLPEDLRIDLFRSAAIGSGSYGCEAWFYTPEVCARINGWAAKMLSSITGRSVHEEAKDPTLNVPAEFEKRQLATVGTILRGHEQSPARLSLLVVLELVDRGLLRTRSN